MDSTSKYLAKRLGLSIKRAVRSKRGEEILDAYRMNLWTEGGCWGLAKAIHREYGGAIFAIVDPFLKPPLNTLAQHVVVELHGVYLDGDGASTLEQLLRRWKKILGNDPRLLLLHETNYEEISCPMGAIKDIQKLLREKVA